MVTSNHQIISVEFEVFGRVHGVYFTKYCRDKCSAVNVVGWIKNSKRGTLIGKMQGERHRVDEMIAWLSKEGSPGSYVQKCDISNFEYLARPEFKGFSIRF